MFSVVNLAFRVDRKLAIRLYFFRYQEHNRPELFWTKGVTCIMEEAKATVSRRATEKSPSAAVGTETLNFKVTSEFKKEFKGYAVSQGMTMGELLKEGFELSKRKRKQ
jgi:hypothetical protein